MHRRRWHLETETGKKFTVGEGEILLFQTGLADNSTLELYATPVRLPTSIRNSYLKEFNSRDRRIPFIV